MHARTCTIPRNKYTASEGFFELQSPWRESAAWTRHETRDQRGWSASLCLLIALIYFLPPEDGEKSCLGPFREIVCARNKGRDKRKETTIEGRKRGEEAGRFKKLSWENLWLTSSLQKSYFYPRRKTGLNHPHKDRRKKGHFLPIYRGAIFLSTSPKQNFNISAIDTAMMLPLNAHRIRYLFLIRFSVHDEVL